MIERPEITETKAQPTAMIHLSVPRSEVHNVMGPAIKEVMDVVSAQGITPAGPWLTHHLKRPGETFEFEVCVPVTVPVKPMGRVRPGILPAATVARTVYHGSYSGLAEAWAEFMAWVEAEGHRPTAEFWECYLLGPESSPNAADWRTEFNQPLVTTAP